MSPGADLVCQYVGKPIGPVDDPRRPVPARLHPGDQRDVIDARQRLLTGRIDRRDIGNIGIVKAGLECVHQVIEARIAVRLGDCDYLASVPATASRAAASTARISTGWWA